MADKETHVNLIFTQDGRYVLKPETRGPEHHQIIEGICNDVSQLTNNNLCIQITKTGTYQSKRTGLSKSTTPAKLVAQMILPSFNSNKYVSFHAAGLAMRVNILNTLYVNNRQSETYWYQATYYNRQQMHRARCTQLIYRFVTECGVV